MNKFKTHPKNKYSQDELEQVNEIKNQYGN